MPRNHEDLVTFQFASEGRGHRHTGFSDRLNSTHLTRKVLFVCTGNYDRSPTAEELFRSVEGLEVDSAGTSPCASTPLSKPVTKRLLEWADIVFAMEDSHKEAMLKIDASAKHKIVVLHIPDNYLRNQPELRKLLLERLAPYFGIRNYDPNEQPEGYMTFFRKLFKKQLPNDY